jgi:hypothetical protein
VFVVEWGKFSFCEKVAAVEAFLELVAGSVFSISDDFFSFFFQVIFALHILTGYRDDASWARHNIVKIRRTILTNLNWDTAHFRHIFCLPRF